MARIDINLTVDGAKIINDKQITITSGSKNYFYTVFELSDHWSDIVPTAVFGNVGEKPYTVDMTKVAGDKLAYECKVPWEVLKDNIFYVGLTGGNTLNTTAFYIKVNQGCFEGESQAPIEDGSDIVYGPDIEVGDNKKLYYESDIKDIVDALAEKTGDEGPYLVSDLGDAIRDIYIPEIIDDGNDIAYGTDTKVADGNKQYNEPAIKDISDAIREKNGTFDSYKVSQMSTAIRDIPQGAALNVEYSQTPPSNTEKLWVKCDKPTNVTVSPQLGIGRNYMEGFPILNAFQAGRCFMGTAVVGTKVYMFGYKFYSTFYKDIYVFDTETETITTLSAAFDIGYSGIGTAVVGTKIYLFGGEYGSASYTDQICVFDTETETLTKLSAKIPFKTAYMGIGVVGKKIYVLGGGNYNLICVFDTETNTITLIDTKLSNTVLGCCSATVGTKIYLFGGYSSGKYLSKISVFDTEDNSITTLGSLPITAQYCNAVAVGTKVYIFGGQTSSSDYTNAIYAFDTVTNTIETLDSTLPTSCCGVGLAFVGNKIYTFGGQYGKSSFLTSIYEFIVSTPLENGNVWIQTDMASNFFPLISGDTAINTGINKVYIGNEDNIMELVEAYIHDGTDWVQI